MSNINRNVVTFTKTQQLCRLGRKCDNDNCPHFHPNGKGHCRFGEDCNSYKCKKIHPNGKGECFYGKSCLVDECDCKHPDGKGFCRYEDDCVSQECKLKHTKGKANCRYSFNCKNNECTLYHPSVPNKIHSVFPKQCKRVHCFLDHFEELTSEPTVSVPVAGSWASKLFP